MRARLHIIGLAIGLITMGVDTSGLDGFGPGPAQAQSSRQDHDRVRDNVRQGTLVPMGTVVKQLRKRFPGRLLDAEHRTDRGIYFIVWQTTEGEVLHINVDARTGRVLKVSRPSRSLRRR